MEDRPVDYIHVNALSKKDGEFDEKHKRHMGHTFLHIQTWTTKTQMETDLLARWLGLGEKAREPIRFL